MLRNLNQVRLITGEDMFHRISTLWKLDDNSSAVTRISHRTFMEALREPHVRGPHNRRPFGTLGSCRGALKRS